MPQYYFNLRNDEVTEDYEGADFPDDASARVYGIKAARTMAAESVRCGWFTASHHVDVLDAGRRHIFTIRFDEAVELRP